MKYKHLINFIESYMDIKLYTYQKILLYLLYYKGIKTNPHNLIMRDATKQEQKSINNYIKSISKDTGVNFFDFMCFIYFSAGSMQSFRYT